MMETIGILGTGRMGIRISLLLADLGHQVILGSRNLERVTRIVRELGHKQIHPGTYREAADAKFILPAMFLRDGSLTTLEPFRGQLDHKIRLMGISFVLNC